MSLTSANVTQEDSEYSIYERTIPNDSGVMLGDSIGEVISTDSEVEIQGTEEDKNRVSEENQIQETLQKVKNKKQSKKRIHRPCLFCPSGKLQSALTRHLKLAHKNEPAVIKAMSLPRREQINAFDNLRKQGIFQHNQKEFSKETPSYIRERIGGDTDELVICTSCKGCYCKRYKARHQLHCGKDSGQVMIPVIPMRSLVLDELKDDFKSVINKMIIDDISTVAKTDPVILTIGSRIYNGQKCKTEKKYEVEKRVRLTMRQLSRLYMKFKESVEVTSDASDLFKQKNLISLRNAIEILCDDDTNMKCGLKVQLQNTIKQAAKILEAHYLVESKRHEAEMVTDFMKVFGLVEEEIFGGALYKIRQKRNKSTRKPGNLPNVETIDELTCYIKEITSKEKISFGLPCSIFVDIRDAACSRLTIYNGRRGGEPARLFIYQWREAVDGIWLRAETRKAYQNEIGSGNRITFQEGKGHKQVPVFIPPDLVPAMEFLCSAEVRKESDVAADNDYVFPSTKGSDNHVSGWHALMACCKKGNLEGKVTGTMNRHRVSTLIGALGLPESEQQLAFDHFGHSGDINRNIYQVPQAERQLASTGKYLQMIDKGLETKETSVTRVKNIVTSNLSQMPTQWKETAVSLTKEVPSTSTPARPSFKGNPKCRKRTGMSVLKFIYFYSLVMVKTCE